MAAQQAGVRANRSQILLLAGFTVLTVVLLWQAGALLAHLKDVLFYPYSLDYGEGIVWQQMRDMLRGTAYGPLRVYPAIVYHYPPVYHMTSAAMAALTGMDQMVAGRLVSILSSFATAAMAGLLTSRALHGGLDRGVRTACGISAGLFFLTCYPVMMWTPLMRVDMLSGALGLAGLLLSLRALDRPAWIYGAAIMFLLSVYAKQISIAAPMAAFSVLLLVRPGLAFRAIGFSLLFGLLALGWLSWATKGGFLTHILAYNINRLQLSSFGDILFPQIFTHMILIALSFLGAAAGWQSVRKLVADPFSLAAIRDALARSRAAVATLMLLLFFGLKTVMLLGVLKSGASFNYMIEWFSAVAIFAGLALTPIVARLRGAIPDGAASPLIPSVLALVALPWQLASLPIDFPASQTVSGQAEERRQIVERIAASPRPVIADDMAMLIRAGRNVEWESAITAELGQLGKYDQQAFAQMVRAHCFGLFVIEGEMNEMPFLARYNPPVAAAIRSAYRQQEKINAFSLLVPSAASSKPASSCKEAGGIRPGATAPVQSGSS